MFKFYPISNVQNLVESIINLLIKEQNILQQSFPSQLFILKAKNSNLKGSSVVQYSSSHELLFKYQTQTDTSTLQPSGLWMFLKLPSSVQSTTLDTIVEFPAMHTALHFQRYCE